jgi:hypothetical protein
MARVASATLSSCVALVAVMSLETASAQSARRDSIGDLLRQATGVGSAQAQSNPTQRSGAPVAAIPEKDPREGDAAYEQAQRLMKAVDAVLQDTAKSRGEVRKLPSKDEYMIPPIWTETKEDREKKVNDLLDAALGIATDVPVVDVQKKIEALKKNIRELDDRIVKLREKQLIAPKDAMLPGVLNDTVDSLGRDIEDTKKKIELNRGEISAAKSEVATALSKSGVQLTPEQVDLLIDGVLAGDLVRLVAVFNSTKTIDAQLAKLMAQSGENVGAARKYFAMHAALFAMLVHAQDMLVAKIDTQYMPKLEAITKDVAAARAKTADLLRAENRPDQKRVLEANRDAQKLADEAAKGYRRYLMQQREQIAKARARATHDLRIADNTFETVEASFQLRNLMKDSTQSFEAIQKLEAPTFEQIFKNEELRREFESLTRKLDVPSS